MSKDYWLICKVCKKRFKAHDRWDAKHRQTCSKKCGGILTSSKVHPEQYLAKWRKSRNGHSWNYKGNLRWEHRTTIEQYLNRKLSSQEVVHHINGDKTNNHISNLYLYSSKSEHRLGHYSMEPIVYELYKQGKVKFNKEQGKYYLSSPSS